MPPAPATPAAPQVTRRAYTLLVFVTAVPALTLLALFLAQVPLGKPGKFTYLYVNNVFERCLSLVYLLPVAVAFLVAVELIGRATRSERRAGNVLLLIAAVGLSFWAFWAPPVFMTQHIFNFVSPSHDGAFVFEVGRFESPLQYLRDFPAYLRTDTPRWGGTRVISNPPGTTLLAWATQQLRAVAPNFWNRFEPADLPADAPWNLHLAFLFSIVIGVLAVLAIPVWVFAARAASRASLDGAIAGLQRPGLCLVVLGVCFSSATVLFTPGKDVMQLVTIGLIAWAWWVAVRRGSVWIGLLAGGAVWLGLWFSLVHVWVALLLAVASLHYTARREPAQLARVARAFTGAFVGVIALVAATWLGGIDFVGILRAVAAGQTEVTRGSNAMPFAWQALGIPLFLLFCGPMVLYALLAPFVVGRLNDNRALFGRTLVLVTVGIMLLTVGFTNVETPRLWIPFAAFLCVGGALQLPHFRTDSPSARTLLVWLAAAQIALTGLQFVLMDMRETEMRLQQTARLDARLWW